YKYFKINDPVRPIIVSLLMLAAGLIFHFLSAPLSVLELHWLLTGERLWAGWLPYRDTLASVGPLSQCVYALLDATFGRSALALRMVGTLAVLIQMILFSIYLINNEILKEKNYIPAIFVCSAMLALPGFITAYPALLGNIFVVAGFSHLMRQLKKQLPEEEYFQSGVYFGIATLFFIPYFWLGLSGIIYLLIYSQTAPRKLSVMLFGLLFPICCTYAIYYLNDASSYFTGYISQSLFWGSHFEFSNWWILSPFLVLAFANIIGLFASRQLINYQLVCRQLHGLWLILGAAIVWAYPQPLTGSWGIIAVPISFFAVQVFGEIKKKGLKGFLFNSMILYGFTIGAMYALGKIQSPQKEEIPSAPFYSQNKKLLILSPEEGYYALNAPSTRYLEWNLARIYF
ncbi:MAG: hypothetical protein K2Q22_14595, partial [Cytophagales bacterium]|nr:hypothetical protein [Cytophagales bacterium]